MKFSLQYDFIQSLHLRAQPRHHVPRCERTLQLLRTLSLRTQALLSRHTSVPSAPENDESKEFSCCCCCCCRFSASSAMACSASGSPFSNANLNSISALSASASIPYPFKYMMPMCSAADACPSGVAACAVVKKLSALVWSPLQKHTYLWRE